MIKAFSPDSSGFCRLFKSDGWQIATITYDKGYSKEGFDHMKKHLTTDEVFVLIKGSAILHTFDNNTLVTTNIEIGKIYCVYKNTWHYLEVSHDALIAVAENSDLLPETTERMELTCLLQNK